MLRIATTTLLVVTKGPSIDECQLRACIPQARRLHPTLESFRGDATMMSAIEDWAAHAKLANMHTERLLSLIKKSSPGKYPAAERICSSGYLAQWLREHRKAGGVDPRGTAANADLVDSGGPMPWAPHSKT